MSNSWKYMIPKVSIPFVDKRQSFGVSYLSVMVQVPYKSEIQFLFHAEMYTVNDDELCKLILSIDIINVNWDVKHLK